MRISRGLPPANDFCLLAAFRGCVFCNAGHFLQLPAPFVRRLSNASQCLGVSCKGDGQSAKLIGGLRHYGCKDGSNRSTIAIRFGILMGDGRNAPKRR
jgi:hypothetical protein